MKRVEPQTVGEILDTFFSNRQLASGLAEGRAVEVWAEVVGDYVAQFTEDVYIRAGVIYVTLSSAAVRSEVLIRRRYYIQKLNQAIGRKVVRSIMVG